MRALQGGRRVAALVAQRWNCDAASELVEERQRPTCRAPVSGGGSKDERGDGLGRRGMVARAAPCGAGTSSTGRTGSPVRRSSTNISPCLVGCDQRGDPARRRGRGRPGSAGLGRPCPRGRGARSGTPSAPGRWRGRARRSRRRSVSRRRCACRPTGRAAGCPSACRPCPSASSTLEMDQLLGELACRSRPAAMGAVSSGLPESQFQTKAPGHRRRRRGPRRTARAVDKLSLTAPPMMTRSPATTGGEVE